MAIDTAGLADCAADVLNEDVALDAGCKSSTSSSSQMSWSDEGRRLKRIGFVSLSRESRFFQRDKAASVAAVALRPGGRTGY